MGSRASRPRVDSAELFTVFVGPDGDAHGRQCPSGWGSLDSDRREELVTPFTMRSRCFLKVLYVVPLVLRVVVLDVVV